MIMKSVSAPLADDQWHKLALIMSGKQLSVLLDCRVILKSILHHQITLLGEDAANSTTFFIGRNDDEENHFLFRVSHTCCMYKQSNPLITNNSI